MSNSETVVAMDRVVCAARVVSYAEDKFGSDSYEAKCAHLHLEEMLKAYDEEYKTPFDVEAAFQAMMGDNKWTSKKPTKNGYYWINDNNNETRHYQIVEVSLDRANDWKVWYVGVEDEDCLDDISADCLWWGPIKAPPLK